MHPLDVYVSSERRRFGAWLTAVGLALLATILFAPMRWAWFLGPILFLGLLMVLHYYEDEAMRARAYFRMVAARGELPPIAELEQETLADAVERIEREKRRRS